MNTLSVPLGSFSVNGVTTGGPFTRFSLCNQLLLCAGLAATGLWIREFIWTQRFEDIEQELASLKRKHQQLTLQTPMKIDNDEGRESSAFLTPEEKKKMIITQRFIEFKDFCKLTRPLYSLENAYLFIQALRSGENTVNIGHTSFCEAYSAACDKYNYVLDDWHLTIIGDTKHAKILLETPDERDFSVSTFIGGVFAPSVNTETNRLEKSVLSDLKPRTIADKKFVYELEIKFQELFSNDDFDYNVNEYESGPSYQSERYTIIWNFHQKY